MISITYKQKVSFFFEKINNSKETTVKLSIFQTFNLICIRYKCELNKGVAYFWNILNTKGNLLINKMQLHVSSPLSVLNCSLY